MFFRLLKIINIENGNKKRQLIKIITKYLEDYPISNNTYISIQDFDYSIFK